MLFLKTLSFLMLSGRNEEVPMSRKVRGQGGFASLTHITWVLVDFLFVSAFLKQVRMC